MIFLSDPNGTELEKKHRSLVQAASLWRFQEVVQMVSDWLDVALGNPSKRKVDCDEIARVCFDADFGQVIAFSEHSAKEEQAREIRQYGQGCANCEAGTGHPLPAMHLGSAAFETVCHQISLPSASSALCQARFRKGMQSD